MPYTNGTSDVSTVIPGQGRTPIVGRWHHIAVTYTGAAGSPAYRLAVYLDGQLSTLSDNRVLFLSRTVPVAVGSWTPANVASNAAIARLRVHDGVLSAEQVFANYVTEGSFTGMVPSPSSTPSNSPTASNTPSSSVTPPNTPSIT